MKDCNLYTNILKKYILQERLAILKNGKNKQMNKEYNKLKKEINTDR